MGSRSGKQLPPRPSKVSKGGHGYNPDYQNMKGIFFAKGPCEYNVVIIILSVVVGM